MGNGAGAAPRGLAVAVALVASAMILVELVVTRIFSVLYFYHYSFFAVSLVMSGLAIGGLAVSRWDARGMEETAFRSRLAGLALVFAAGIVAALAALLLTAEADILGNPTLKQVALGALAFLPGLAAAGGFLAVAFARREEWIGRLYAADLGAAAVSCLAAIAMLRIVQGPAGFLAPAALSGAAAAAIAPRGSAMRLAGGLAALLLSAAAAGAAAGATPFLNLRDKDPKIYERWNEHSRIIARDADEIMHDGRRARMLVIDKSAATFMPAVKERAAGEPPPIEPWWSKGCSQLAYRLGRPLDDVAVIGVGGARDMLGAISNGARHIDGYEINGILLDLLQNKFAGYNPIASWPEVSLHHSEARVGIARSGKKYDVIQASLIDTWSAMANGGLALSENGLYTVEGWKTFLDAMSPTGVLTMTRWHLPGMAAETDRLVALAATSLEEAGLLDIRSRIILVAYEKTESHEDVLTESLRRATILVSKAPFTPEEVARVQGVCKELDLKLLLAPGVPSPYEILDRLVDPSTRGGEILKSPFDISPPTDLRPYFFLQVRPFDIFSVWKSEFSLVTSVTFEGLRALMALCCVAVLLAAAVLAAAAATLPSASSTRRGRRVYRWMGGYFLGIGLGYIMVQLSLHQRLILILGHPTYALSVVLFSMLLGTGLGSAATARLFPDERIPRAWIAILGTLALLAAALTGAGALEAIGSAAGRAAVVAVAVGAAGFVMGFAFPIGVRIVSRTGEWAVQKMWAVNGAASIAGSALAALSGLMFGSRNTLLLGMACYLCVAYCGMKALRAAGESEGS